MPAIDRRTRIAAMLQEYPQTAAVLQRHHLGCFGCQGARHETIESGATAHGLDVETLLRDLNAAITPPV